MTGILIGARAAMWLIALLLVVSFCFLSIQESAKENRSLRPDDLFKMAMMMFGALATAKYLFG